MNILRIVMVASLGYSTCFAYLDPGSGSLLLSSIVAIFASAVFFFKGIFYKIASIFSVRGGATTFRRQKDKSATNSQPQSRQNNRHGIVFYSEGKQYYNTFKPILDYLDSANYPYTFYTSDEADPALSRNIKNPSTQISYIGKGNTAYIKLNTLKADILCLTLPGLNVLHIKRHKGVKHYCHIVHSLSPMTYRTFGVDYFDSVLVANEVQIRFVRDVWQAHNIEPKPLKVVGSCYFDELSALHEKLKNNTEQNPLVLPNQTLAKNTSQNTKTILVSPSWGKETLLSKYGLKLLLPLAKSEFNIIIRPHPQSLISPSESQNIASLKQNLESYKNVIWDEGTPNIYAFERADLMISDFSSVIFDFVCLCGKPVLTMDFEFDAAGYDIADIDMSEFWTFKALKRIGDRLSENDIERVAEIAKGLIESSAKSKEIADTKKELIAYHMEAGQRSAIEILGIQKDILLDSLGGYAEVLERLQMLENVMKKDK